MYLWLVTVRAADHRHATAVRALLHDHLLPLLRGQPAADCPQLAACVNCTGESTYLARWPDTRTVEAFEASPTHRALLDRLGPVLWVPPQREPWEILPSERRA